MTTHALYATERLSDRLVLRGEVDEHTCQRLADDLSLALFDGLVVDLSAVTFFPSVGVNAVAQVMHRAQLCGVQLRVVTERGCLADRILSICGIPHSLS
jgi:anti-anti-sigma factor